MSNLGAPQVKFTFKTPLDVTGLLSLHMIAQSFFVGDITPALYDQRLAEGWFRDSMMMYRSDLVVMQSELFEVVHIRFNARDFEPRKSQRRVMRRVEERFRVEVKKPQITEQHNQLYLAQINRFRGFIHPKLEDILFRSESDLIQVYELSLYDGDRLIAASYFDTGEKSMASLLCLHDPEYAQYSLGYYTMLREMHWGQNNSKEWYYPGYIFDLPSEFDYKLRLGVPQTMVEPGEWVDGVIRKGHTGSGERIRSASAVMESFLSSRKISFRKRYYPYFAAVRMMNLHQQLFSLPVFYEIMDGEVRYGACFDPLSNMYFLHRLEDAREFHSMISMPLSAEYLNNLIYETRLLKVTSTVPVFPGGSGHSVSEAV
jgi:arginine-tRNA-protein transferase